MVFEHPEVDVDGDRAIRGSAACSTKIDYVTWKPERKFLDPATEALYAALERRLPGKEVYVSVQSRPRRGQ